jgi:hypothetical protein
MRRGSGSQAFLVQRQGDPFLAGAGFVLNQDKGRYFTAKVFNSKGRVVNAPLVDKLNGAVKFIR